jgi:hypothetical protein
MRARPPGTVAPRRGRVRGLCCKLCGGGTALLAWVLLGLLCGGAVLFANLDGKWNPASKGGAAALSVTSVHIGREWHAPMPHHTLPSAMRGPCAEGESARSRARS